MNPAPHYKYLKPYRISIVPSGTASYSADRLGEDEDIRYGFGHCSRINRSHIEVAEIDFSWLGVIFHIVKTNEFEDDDWDRIDAARHDIEAMKTVARSIVLDYFRDHPEEHERMLERIHEGSLNQARLDMALGTAKMVDPGLDLTRN